ALPGQSPPWPCPDPEHSRKESLMLTGIDPLLGGDLLRILDHMGHNDSLLVTDAHYPAHAMGVPVVDLATTSPQAVQAIRTVLPVDMYAGPSVTLMTPEPGTGEEVQPQLQEATAVR